MPENEASLSWDEKFPFNPQQDSDGEDVFRVKGSVTERASLDMRNVKTTREEHLAPTSIDDGERLVVLVSIAPANRALRFSRGSEFQTLLRHQQAAQRTCVGSVLLNCRLTLCRMMVKTTAWTIREHEERHIGEQGWPEADCCEAVGQFRQCNFTLFECGASP